MNRKLVGPTPFGPVVLLWSDPGGGPKMKQALLEREGIAFDASGRILAARLHYS